GLPAMLATRFSVEIVLMPSRASPLPHKQSASLIFYPLPALLRGGFVASLHCHLSVIQDR
ncbi:hypothetical protein, partial [Pseudomonas sp. PS02285]|uniref:hypothetical protein n=1 Tax=Pseudomonas sp. PS02285 TaxID=2991441 RepID=UPI00249C3372